MRPDPAFKEQTGRVAEEIGVKSLPTEFPQTLRGDLVFFAPPGVVLAATLFSFFLLYDVLEFKGENDELNETEFHKNEVRCRLLFIQLAETGRPIKMADILNLFVCARYPAAFFAHMVEQGVHFAPVEGQPWLYEAKVGMSWTRVVVCRDLPLEAVYYPWLLFAPSDSIKWRKFILQLIYEQNIRFLDLALELRPKELQNMSVKTTKYFSEYTPEERKQYWAEYGDIIIEVIPDLEQEAPEVLDRLLGRVKPETLAAAIKPETLALVEPETLAAAIKPETLAAAIKPETLALVEPETFAKLTPEQRQRLRQLLSEPPENEPSN